MDETASHSQAESELTPQPLRLAPPIPQPLPVTILQSFSPPKQERTLLHDYSNIYMDSSGEEDSIPAPLSATMPSMTRMSPGDDTLGRRTPTNRPLELPSLSHASVIDFRRPRASSSPRERPPMSEVLLNPEIEPNENDTFSEEPSLEPKVRRSLNLTPATPPRMSTPRRNFYRRTHPPSISPGTKQSPDSDKNVNGASPAWMRIKNDLQSSNEKLGKVEKENVKLAETCKSLTEELRRMSESADQVQSLQDEVKNLKRAMDLLSHQNKQLSKEKRALMFGARQLEEEKELLDEARLAAERSEMNVIEDFHDMEEKILNLEEELKAMKEDRDRIATELEQSIQSKLVVEQEKTEMVIRMHSVNDEAVQSSPPTETAAPTTASKAETTLRRKGELQKREIAQLRSALDEERNRCKELEESSVAYKSEAQTLQKEVEALKREVSNLKNALYDPQASNGAGAFHEDQENRNNDLEEANNLMKLEIVQLTAELEDANLQAQTLERSASRADTEIQSLLEDNDSLRTEVAQMTAHLRDTAAECDKLKNEINTLQGDRDSLQQQVQELQQSIASKSASSTEMGTQTDYSLEPASPQRQRQNTGSPSVSSLSERIDRIRDSAERATLIRDHQREMLRVRKEHEAEVSKLRAEHDSLIRRLAKEAKAEMDIRNKDLQRRLEAEYETKMSDLARHHEKEVSRVSVRGRTDFQSKSYC